MQRHPLLVLRESLHHFDKCDLLSRVAALQLMPENADQALRLEALAQVVSSLPCSARPLPTISGTRFKSLCEGPELGGLKAYEDPFNNPFTEAVGFHGGNFVVFPGILDDAAYIFRQMIRGLSRRSAAISSDAYIERARQVITAALVLSDEVARRSGIGRGTAAVSRDKRPILLPAAARFTRLRRAVAFDHADLLRLLGRYRVDVAAIDPLSVSFGQAKATDVQITGGSLSKTPVVRSENRWIVAVPGALISAAWVALIAMAREAGIASALGGAFHEATWASVQESLAFMGHEPRPSPIPGAIGADGVSEGFFELDTDKLLHVLLVTDGLRDYFPADPYGEWPIESEMDDVRARIREVHSLSDHASPGPQVALSLVLTQGVGRSFATHLDLPGEADILSICLSAANLETVAALEGGDRLFLLKYARACRKLHSEAHVVCFGELDKISMYIDTGHCFYFNDDARPDLVSVYPDFGGALRQKAVEKRDWHAALSYRPGYYTEVVSLHGTGQIPLYVERRIVRESDPRPAVLVEGLPRPIWVIGPGREAARLLEDRDDVPFVLASSIAYWLWQLAPSLAAPVAAIAAEAPVLVEISVIDGVLSGPSGVEPGETSPVRVVAARDSARVTVFVAPDVMRLFGSDDNRGERELMGAVLSGLGRILPPESPPLLSGDAIARCLDLHAPLGRKKMILPLNPATTPTLDPSGLPDLRLVQEADEGVFLDELGDHLTRTKGLAIGPIADDRRCELLNDCAGFAFENLVASVSTLDPRGLLERLVAAHEALLYEVESTRLTIPTRLECFGGMAKMVERIAKELPDRYKASVALRFLIEYVVSAPPKSATPISLEAYDRLLVLASEVVTFGQLSDTVRYDVADVRLSILPSVRLGISRDHLQKARQAFLPVQAHGEVRRAMRNFGRYWRTSDEGREKPPLVDVMDAATLAEFGFTLTEFGRFAAECLAVGDDLDPAVCRMPLATFRERLCDALAWGRDRVGAMIDMLSLGPRPSYLVPPKPFQKEDVYPWRYNRALSYLRRPFLRRETAAGPEILWGPRQLYAAHENLVGLCMTGRLRARSPEMKRLIGRMLNEQGEAFNDEVTDALSLDKTLVVRARLKKIPKLRGELEQLGDIDVFVVDISSRRAYVVECKDLEGARTPFEMSNELANFFRTDAQRRSIVDKHQGRVRWVRKNLGEVLEHLQVASVGEWEVGSLIVIDRELLTPFLRASPVPIIPMERIKSTSPNGMGAFLMGNASFADHA